MPHSPHYHTMTDAQLAEWDQLHRRLDNALAVIASVTEERDLARSVQSILRTELGAVIHAIREFRESLLMWMIPRHQGGWPDAFGEAWLDLTEMVDSAARCLE